MDETTCRLVGCVKEMLAVLTEPGIMDVDEWKAWKRRTEEGARKLLAELGE